MTSDAASLPALAPLPALDYAPLAGSGGRFTPAQKAAMIIAALGQEAAGPVIERIGERHLKAFADAYTRLKDIPRRELLAVVSEFLAEVEGGPKEGLKGGFEETRELIASFKGDASADKLLDDIEAPGGRSVWQKLDSVDPKALAEYLSGQHPQTIAVVLMRMDGDKASALLSHLNDDLSERVLFRLSKQSPARREALRVLADTIEQDFLAPARRAAKARKPGEVIGSMLNNMSEERRVSLLQLIEAKAPALLKDVKSYILTFADIPTRAPANAVAKLVREIDAQVFLKAAKYGRQNAPETINFLFANISQRLAQQYEEQMQDMKPVTVAEAEAAQVEIVSALRRLVAAGEIELEKLAEGGETEEVYI